MDKLILIKLGGSLITNKGRPFSAHKDVIRRLGQEVRSAKKTIKDKIVIGHGSGSFGHTLAKKYQTQRGILGSSGGILGLTLVKNAAASLNGIVTEIFLDVGLPVFPFSPSNFIVSQDQKGKVVFLDPITEALKRKVIPLVYGDIIFDTHRGYCIFSTEKVLGAMVEGLSKKYEIKKVIYCGNTDGVYDHKGNTIPIITRRSFKKFEKDISGSDAPDVTGGMVHKVEESLKMAIKFKLETIIINGEIQGRLKKALLGEEVPSTRIVV